ncbi:hypothetical protein HZA86_02690 [Candidatus Uhrbacteria bacterium]|nr:hypothetical protein [Candidatus Uhrbacteria bacterium]
MKYVKQLHQIDKNDTPRAGGKAASLGELMKAGVAVTPGFVILTNAFEWWTTRKTEIPSAVAQEIQTSFQSLGSSFVAVRSSATAEDSTSAAWAGMLATSLYTTKDTLLEHVKDCWASLSSARALAYRMKKGAKENILVAVVIQKMIESEKSGTAFSVHPVTHDNNQLIIEAGWGLREAIVSGQITPNSYVVDKRSRQIVDKRTPPQSRALYRRKNGGIKWRTITGKQRAQQVLSDREIVELSEIILRIEDHFGFPCDIEWAFENGNFYILQSRPITTLS